jgi:hypothetical protein
MIDVFMEYAQSPRDTLMDGLFINLNPLGPDVPLADEEIQ